MTNSDNSFWLESYQAQKFNNIIHGYDDMEPPYLLGKKSNSLNWPEEGVSENMLQYLDVGAPAKIEFERNQKGQKFYKSYNNDNFFKNLSSLKMPLYYVNEIETNKNKAKQNPDKRRKPNLFKVEKMLNKKTERSPSPKVNYITNIYTKKQVSEFNSPVKIPKEKINENDDTHLKVIEKAKGVESNKICTQEMSNKSTESSELNGNHLSRKSHQDSIRAKKDAEFIFHLGEANNQLKSINKNIEENNLIENLKNFLKGKKFTNILDIKIAIKVKKPKDHQRCLY